MNIGGPVGALLPCFLYLRPESSSNRRIGTPIALNLVADSLPLFHGTDRFPSAGGGWACPAAATSIGLGLKRNRPG
jgi:hypothetical protein